MFLFSSALLWRDGGIWPRETHNSYTLVVREPSWQCLKEEVVETDNGERIEVCKASPDGAVTRLEK